MIHTTYAISPTLLNEVAFNYNGNRINIVPTGLYQAPSSFNFNRLFTGPNSDNRIPAIQLSGPRVRYTRSPAGLGTTRRMTTRFATICLGRRVRTR